MRILWPHLHALNYTLETIKVTVPPPVLAIVQAEQSAFL